MASEDDASDAQIKRLYAVLHSLNIDPKEWKKEQGFNSFAKLTRGQCSEYIEQLEEIETKKEENFKGDLNNGVQRQIGDEFADAEAEISRIALAMRFAAREASAIVEQEVDGGGIGEATKSQLTERFAVTIFIEAMKRGMMR